MSKQPRGNSARVIVAILLVPADALIIGSFFFFTAVDLASKNGAESEHGVGYALESLAAAAAFVFCAVKLLETARDSHSRQSDDNVSESITTETASDNDETTYRGAQ